MTLSERVEALQGPDREVDCLIFVETAESPFVSYYPDCVLASIGGFAARLEIADIPFYTDSIDAAVALVERVLPGWWWWSVQSDGLAHLAREGETSEAYSGPTPAIALLRALLSSIEPGEQK